MADVISDTNGSNGVQDANDEIRVNGEKFDDPVDQKFNNDSLADGHVTKKHLPDVNSVDKLYELAEKGTATIANGHLKSDIVESKMTCGKQTDSSNDSVNDEIADEQNDRLKGNELNADNNCDDESMSSVDNNHSNTCEDVLNLKTNNRHDQDAEEGSKPPSKSSDADVESKAESQDGSNPSGPVENESKEEESVTTENSQDKQNKKNKKQSIPLNITPRRSSRNLNKQKSYTEKEPEIEEDEPVKKKSHDDDEIEEVALTDPLADDPKSKMRSKTIVVSDTKGLVEFASNTKASRSNKKEPTLVIIDTNSILSGRGPVPVSQSNTTMLHSSTGSAPIPVSLPIPAGALANATRGVPASTSAFSVIPIGIPTQGMYTSYKNPPPQMKPIVVGPASTTVTPITIQAASTVNTPSVPAAAKQPPVILPSLTDDMFVVEAPSFIVPYVYEKPPMKSLKDYIEKLDSEIKEAEEKERLEREEKEKEEKERLEKEKILEKEKAEETKSDSNVEETETEEDKDVEKSTLDVKKEETPENESEKSSLLMEVEEETDPNAAKVISDSDVILVSSKKEDEKKEETSIQKDDKKVDDTKKPISYFDNPLGKFFMQIGLNLVQEQVQTDLLRSQKRKRDKEGEKCSPDVKMAIETLTKTLESSKENNDPFKLDLRKCELCSFKTESILVMAHHLETPHMKNYTYRCNFCPMEVRSPHDILYHMEAEHNVRGRLERAPCFHQCPNCPFEDNQKGKLTRHLVSCSKKYRPEKNQEPPLDWEPPAKIPRVTRNRPPSMSPGNAVYQAAMSGLKQVPQNTLLPKLMPNTATNLKQNLINATKRPNPMPGNFINRFPGATPQSNFQQRPISVQGSNQGLMYRTPGTNTQTQVLLQSGYQLSGAQIYQQNPNIKQTQQQQQQQQQGLATTKLLNQPSISITPLPRQTSTAQSSSSSNMHSNVKPGKPTTNTGGKSSFVVCEICDGYIKDLEQLRNHMQWIHKVKIHPKMIYNRPPLNCQKCQFRFFTDQGLERHLLGSHGLVTSSMQEAANKGKDSGRCPVCGRVYQWKLLNHVARDHQMALKPAHLSYKCTVCTATFGMYKQFESHVYSAHSVVAKRAMDTKKPPVIPQASSNQNDMLKPLKINDEITIIPQPVRSTKPNNKPGPSPNTSISVSKKKDWDDDEDSDNDDDADDNIIGSDNGIDEVFKIKEEQEQHASNPQPKEFRVVVNRVDLRRFSVVPDKKNAFFLPEEYLRLDPMRLRKKFGLKDLHIRLKNLTFLRCDYVYEVIFHNDLNSEIFIPDTILTVSDECIPNTNTPRALAIKQCLPASCKTDVSSQLEKPRQLLSATAGPSPSATEHNVQKEAYEKFMSQPHFLMGTRLRLENSKRIVNAPFAKRSIQLKSSPVTVAGALRPHRFNVSGPRMPTPLQRPRTISSTQSTRLLTGSGVRLGKSPLSQMAVRRRLVPSILRKPVPRSTVPYPVRASAISAETVISLLDDDASPTLPPVKSSISQPVTQRRAHLPKDIIIDLLDSESSSDSSDLEIIESENALSPSNEYILPV